MDQGHDNEIPQFDKEFDADFNMILEAAAGSNRGRASQDLAILDEETRNRLKQQITSAYHQNAGDASSEKWIEASRIWREQVIEEAKKAKESQA